MSYTLTETQADNLFVKLMAKMAEENDLKPDDLHGDIRLHHAMRRTIIMASYELGKHLEEKRASEEIADLRAKLAKAQQDSERLDMVEKHALWFSIEGSGEVARQWSIDDRGSRIRLAIDMLKRMKDAN